MEYEKELKFLRLVLAKYHLQALELGWGSLAEGTSEMADRGLRKFLGREAEQERLVKMAADWVKPNTICKLRDLYLCSYVFLQLPGGKNALLIGPYLNGGLSRGQIETMAERQGIPLRLRRQLESYYSAIPCVHDEYPLFALINSFGELIWGGADAFSIVDLNQETSGAFSPLEGGEPGAPDETLLNMQIMETRYSYENELLDAVSQGHVHRAELMFSHLLQTPADGSPHFQMRSPDPVRNFKNYCIIMNTLLRKSAEKGGVHPIYLDSVSSHFAFQIEALRSVNAGQALMNEMVLSYCRLVRKHSIRSYSSPVQKAITHIDSDLGGDLSLASLSAMQNISAGYLSSIFKKETGQTITEHISRKRIDLAIRLLTTTRMQIQSIAQACGFSDVNYFSKTFKKYISVTPKEYRKNAVGISAVED